MPLPSRFSGHGLHPLARPALLAAIMRAGFLLSALPLPAVAASLQWGPDGKGGSGNWDANVTPSWFNGQSPTRWPAPGGSNDDAVFGGVAGTVLIVGNAVGANDLTFAANGYRIQQSTLTLNGSTPTITTNEGVTATITAAIAGTAGLTKAGAGTLILAGNNAFSGNVTITGGLLQATRSSSFGTGNKTVIATNSTSLRVVFDGSSGNLNFPANIGLNLSGARLRSISGNHTWNGPLGAALGAGTAFIACDSGTLTFTGTVRAVNSGGRTLDFGGTSTEISQITGQIIDGVSPLNFRKSGTGTWKIANRNNTYTGNTSVNSGKLILAGNLQSAALTVATNARLAVEGAVTTAGAFTLDAGATLELRAMPSETDRLSVAGNVMLAGNLDLLVSASPAVARSFVILNNLGNSPITGTFAGLAEGALFVAGGQTWQITYSGGDGNDVVLRREPTSLETFEERRDERLAALRGQPFVQGYISPSPEYRRPESYTYMNFALRCFLNDEQLPEANDAVLAFCNQYADQQYFDNLDWMSDMAFRLIEDYGSQGSVSPGKLTQTAENALYELFWQYARRHSNLDRVAATPANVWTAVGGTENLIAMNVATLWHAAKLLRNHPAYAGLTYDNGVTPEVYYQASTAYYKEWLRERARKGMLTEFSNNHYGPVTAKGIYNFVDYAEDPELRELARKWLDLFWLTWAQEQIHGVKGGGMARIYQQDWGKSMSMEGLNNPFSDIFWCYTGLGKSGLPVNNVLTYLASSYRPPALAIDLATDLVGRGSYASIERKMGRAINGTQQIDLNETFTRYTYTTPDFILGTFHVGNWRYWWWQMISSQNRWHGAIFNSHPDARIYFQCSVIPTGQLNYNQHWSVQSRNAIIVQKLNNAGTESTRIAKYAGEMKVWVSAAGRTELLERGGWVFASYGTAYAALRVVEGGFRWRDDEEPAYPGEWMVLDHEYSPVVMEIGRAADFTNFTAFQDRILTNPLTYADAVVNYQSTPGDTLTLDAAYRQSPQVNGVPLNYKPANAYDSPFVTGSFGSGVVNAQKGNRQLTLDFNAQVPTSLTWTAGHDVWDTSTRNWNQGSAHWQNTTGATAVFSGPLARVILTNGLYSAGLTFNTQTTLSGAPLTLTGTTPQLHTAPDITARLQLPLQGRKGMTKSGPGTVILTRDALLHGTCHIEAGILQLGDGGTSGSLDDGPIINQSLLRINRSGTVRFPFPLSGTGDVEIANPTSSDTVVLAAANPFTGRLMLTRGTVRLAHSASLGHAPRNLTLHESQAMVELGGETPVHLPPSLSFNLTGACLHNRMGTNQIAGTIQLGDSGTTTVTSTAGSLHLAGDVIGATNVGTLELSGESIDDNLVSGAVRDGSGPTSIMKSGPGTWRISGSQAYTGSTTVTAGTLVLDGQYVGDIQVVGGQLTTRQNVAIAGKLTITADGALQARPQTTIEVGGTITLAGRLNLDVPRGTVAGSQWTILQNQGTNPIVGTFADLPEAQPFNASGDAWRISYVGGDGNDVVLTKLTGPSSHIEIWRDVHFGFFSNSGDAADLADPDDDGLTNAQEFAIGSNPNNLLDPPSFVWTQVAGGDWDTPSHWSTRLVPPGNRSRTLEFFADSPLPGGTTNITNNLPGTYVLNQLKLRGTSQPPHSVTLTGAALELQAHGNRAPALILAPANSPITYTLTNPVQLSADASIDAMHGGQVILAGLLSGLGGITYTGTGTNLVMTGNHTYQGTTHIKAGLLPGTIRAFSGTLQIGNGGATGAPGPGAIINDGTLAINRTGTLELTNSISGSGQLLISPPNTGDTVRLSGENTFSGDITLSRGRLVITRSTSLGRGEKSLVARNGNARLELEGGSSGIVLDANLSMTLSGTELRNVSGNNVVRGEINAATGAGGTAITSNGGALTLAGMLQTANSGGRTVTLGGSSPGPNVISGRIIDGVSALSIQKSGSGTWTLSHHANSYTGTTTLNGGRLILTGSLTSSIITNAATLAPQGTPTTTGSLTQTPSSAYQIRVTPAGSDRLSVQGPVTLGGTLELLPSPGIASQTSMPILSPSGTGAITGTFANLPENATFEAGGYQWRISYRGGDGNEVILTNVTPPPPATPITQWRLTHFATSENSGSSADLADPNDDGEPNLVEFATGQNPLAPSRAASVQQTGAGLVMTYSRSKAAVTSGYTLVVEWSDTLSTPWTTTDPGIVIQTTGDLETMRTTLPPSPTGKRFARLKVSSP